MQTACKDCFYFGRMKDGTVGCSNPNAKGDIRCTDYVHKDRWKNQTSKPKGYIYSLDDFRKTWEGKV